MHHTLLLFYSCCDFYVIDIICPYNIYVSSYPHNLYNVNTSKLNLYFDMILDAVRFSKPLLLQLNPLKDYTILIQIRFILVII